MTFFGPWDETTGRSKEVMVTPPWFWTVLLIPCRRMRHDAPVSPKCFWSMNNWGNWQWGEDTWFRPCWTLRAAEMKRFHTFQGFALGLVSKIGGKPREGIILGSVGELHLGMFIWWEVLFVSHSSMEFSITRLSYDSKIGERICIAIPIPRDREGFWRMKAFLLGHPSGLGPIWHPLAINWEVSRSSRPVEDMWLDQCFLTVGHAKRIYASWWQLKSWNGRFAQDFDGKIWGYVTIFPMGVLRV